jgi:hypothetical protein
MCYTVAPFGKYQFFKTSNRHIILSRYFPRKIFSALMQHLNFLFTYLDDLFAISSSTCEALLEKLEGVFKILSINCLRVNAEQSTFCADEIEYLGY